MKTPKTNAMRLLDRLSIPYTPHAYPVNDGALDGISVATKMGQDLACVFKTLVSRGASGALLVFVIPVRAELNLKAAAKAAGEKSVAMLPQAELLPATGYKKGGCSPLGMRKQYPTFLEETAIGQPAIYVSGGQIGVQIELAPADLLRAAGAVPFANGGVASPPSSP